MKTNKSRLTSKLIQNWWIDAVLAFSAITAVISSLYFLAFPINGFQGGRNPYYNTVLILSRQGWDFLHTWTGIAMILAALIHIFIHWEWIVKTARRSLKVVTRQRRGFGTRLTYNILLDAVLALCFVLCAMSGVYFLLFPHSSTTTQKLFVDKTLLDLIHTWSGIFLTITAILHFVHHWKWVENITKKIMKAHKPEPAKAGIQTGFTSVE